MCACSWILSEAPTGAPSAGGMRETLGVLAGMGFWLSLTLAWSAAPLRAAATDWHAGVETAHFRSAPDSLRHTLPHRWIQGSSFELLLGEEPLLRGIDFLLDPRRGTVRLLRELPGGSVLTARYRRFPRDFPEEFRRRRPQFPAESREPAAVRNGASAEHLASAEDADGSRLQIAGSKTFAVEVGTQEEFAFRQSLDLSVRGTVGRSVSVRAILTDRNTPLLPDGTSTSLEEVDRVLVQVSGPNARMTLGDLSVSATGSRFARFRRQLEGAEGDAAYGDWRISASAASARGRFVSVAVPAVEGKQGPYRLTSSLPGERGAVVAGSEQLYFEGERLIRGENHDYVIDYASGEISFTSRRVVFADARITVDFELSSEAYSRNVYASGVTLREPAPRAARGGEALPEIRLGASESPILWSEEGPLAAAREPVPGRSALFWVSERDDRARPSAPLSAVQKEALRAAGDSLSESLRSGIEFVGPGGGEYDRVESDTLAAPFFVYVGAPGSYRVRFEEVGSARGDYADTTTVFPEDPTPVRYFVFVGRKRGDYLPGREVPRPLASTVLAWNTSGEGGALAWSTELAYSRHDPNTFSSRDDQDNQGGAGQLELRSSELAWGALRLSGGARYREVGARFHPIDRLDPALFHVDWNVDAARLNSGDRRTGVEGKLLWPLGQLGLRAERLSNTRDFSAERWIGDVRARALSVNWNASWLEARSRDDLAPGNGRRVRRRFELERPLGGVRVQASFRAEENRSGEGALRTGNGYDEGRVSLRRDLGNRGLSGALALTRRDSRSLAEGAFRRTAIGETGEASLDLRAPSGTAVNLDYTLRRLTPRAAPPTQSHLGRMRWSLRGGGEGLQQDGQALVSTTEQLDRLKEIRFVGDGLGHYDSLGVYQGIGDFEVLYRDLGESRLLNRVELSLQSEVDLDRSAGVETTSAVFRLPPGFRATHTFRARVESARSLRTLLDEIGPSLLARRKLPLGEFDTRLDLAAWPRARFFAPRLRVELEARTRELVGDTQEEHTQERLSLRLRSRPRPVWSVDLEGELERDRSRITDGPQDGWRSARLRLDQRVQLGNGWTPGLDGFVRERARIVGGERARVVEATPYVVVSPGAGARIEVRATRTSLARKEGAGRPSRELEKPGWTLRALASVRLHQALDLSGFLRESRPDHGTTIRDGRIELRASF